MINKRFEKTIYKPPPIDATDRANGGL